MTTRHPTNDHAVPAMSAVEPCIDCGADPYDFCVCPADASPEVEFCATCDRETLAQEPGTHAPWCADFGQHADTVEECWCDHCGTQFTVSVGCGILNLCQICRRHA